jgi:hypothetical protein
VADEGLWYVLLINKARVGDHWLLKKMTDVDMDRWADHPDDPDPNVKTSSYHLAARFGTEGECLQFKSMCGYLPPDFIAQAVQIVPPRKRRRPEKRYLPTPYGPVTLLEGQMCLFGEPASAVKREEVSSVDDSR